MRRFFDALAAIGIWLLFAAAQVVAWVYELLERLTEPFFSLTRKGHRMALPVPDYPVEFPTDSALFLGKFVLARFPVEDRVTAFDQANILLLFGSGKIRLHVGPNVVGAESVAVSVESAEPIALMNAEQLRDTALEITDPPTADATAKFIGPLEIVKLIQFAWTIIQILRK